MEKSTSIRPRKSLGQHFLKDRYYLGKIMQAAGIGPADCVIEIGPGLGHLTRMLIGAAQRVVAVELDGRLVEHLRREFTGNEKIEIVHADALEYPFGRLPGIWKVVANLPYYISTPVIRRLIEFRRQFSSLTLMLQREVAERIAARPGGKQYGFLSVLVQCYAEPRIAFTVPPRAFTPPPEVESAVMTLRLRERPLTEVHDENFFMNVVKAAFSQRRKTLGNSLKQLGISKENIERAGIGAGVALGRRAETLSVEEFGALARLLRSEAAQRA